MTALPVPPPDNLTAFETIRRDLATEPPATVAARLIALVDAELSRPPNPMPGDLDLGLAEQKTLEVRRAECLPNRLIRAELTVRDAAGNYVKSHSVVFGSGQDERHAREALLLDSTIMAGVARHLRAAVLESDDPNPAFARRSRIIRASAIHIEETQWLIRDTLPAHGLVVLYGGPATLKSFTAIDMAAAILTGQDWAGQPTTAGAVLYIAAEGQAGIKRRLRAWEIVHGASLDDLLILPEALHLIDPGDRADLLAEVTEIAAVYRAPSLVVIDTLARNMGGDENSTTDMNALIHACDDLRTATGATVVIVHHTNKADLMRGSNALPAAVDVQIRADRRPGARAVTLTCEKLKDGEEFPPLTLDASPVDLGIMDRWQRPITSLVLRSTPPDQLGPPAPPPAVPALTPTQAAILHLLRDARDGLTATAWKTAAITSGFSHGTFYNTLPVLEASGQIRSDGKGRGARYFAISPSVQHQSNSVQLDLPGG